ncbi:MAG TPA: transglycosylase family protein [Solirubrobacteraceae bacterium]|nr:transglycosylase family protein [Solirubrobacteraceae bacterium]
MKRPALLAVCAGAVAGPAIAAPPAVGAGVASLDQARVIDPVVVLAEKEQARHARRHVRLERKNAKLKGERAPRPSGLRREISDWSTGHLRRENRSLARSNRKLKRRLARAAAAAPAAPPHLQAIAACESGGNPGAVDASGTYRGKYQFDAQTWASVGGSGDPAAASEAEQDRRAAMLYSRAGSTPWPVCGG